MRDSSPALAEPLLWDTLRRNRCRSGIALTSAVLLIGLTCTALTHGGLFARSRGTPVLIHEFPLSMVSSAWAGSRSRSSLKSQPATFGMATHRQPASAAILVDNLGPRARATAQRGSRALECLATAVQPTMEKKSANIAVIGAGWWSQGWHFPALNNNERANLIAIVDTSPHPKSNLNPNLEPLSALKDKYKTQIFSSVDDLLKELGPELDGVLIATPHASHYGVGRQIMSEIDRRNNNGDAKPLHILMEKPMTTDINHALGLYDLVKNQKGQSKFWINHSANFRIQAKLAREAISSGRLGRIRHITAYFASPLKSIFMDPANKGWNEPSDGMLGNGFAWGQSSHLFAFIYHICPDLQPVDVFCAMTHSGATGADVSHSATIRLSDGKHQEYVVASVSGTTLLPGDAHTEPPVPKFAQIEIFGDEASLHYAGNDRDPSSGRLELRTNHGTEVLYDKFHFENLDSEGTGPESLQNFVGLCDGDMDVYTGADVMDGLRSIQTIDAMYKSQASHQTEKVIMPE